MVRSRKKSLRSPPVGGCRAKAPRPCCARCRATTVPAPNAVKVRDLITPPPVDDDVCPPPDESVELDDGPSMYDEASGDVAPRRRREDALLFSVSYHRRLCGAGVTARRCCLAAGAAGRVSASGCTRGCRGAGRRCDGGGADFVPTHASSSRAYRSSARCRRWNAVSNTSISR